MARSYVPAVEMCEDRVVLTSTGLLGSNLMPALPDLSGQAAALFPTTNPVLPTVTLISSAVRAVDSSPLVQEIRTATESGDNLTWVAPQPARPAPVLTSRSDEPIVAVVHPVLEKVSSVKSLVPREAIVRNAIGSRIAKAKVAEHKQEAEKTQRPTVTAAEVRAAERGEAELRAEDARAARAENAEEKSIHEKPPHEKGSAGRHHEKDIEEAQAGRIRFGEELVAAAVVGTVVESENAEASATTGSPSELALGGGNGLVTSFLPFELSSLEEGMDRLLAQLGDLRQEVRELLLSGGATPWIAVATAALLVAEVARRRRQRRKSGQAGYLAGACPVV